MVKKLWLTILLAIVIYGVGHMYLGFIKRGIIILIIGIVIAAATPILIPIPFSWIIIIGYWIWEIWDAYKHYKKLNAGQPQMTR